MSRGAGGRALALAAGAALALAGCAGPALRASAPPAPAPAPPAAAAAAPVLAVPDTVPSADALAVLAGIPEALPPGERLPAPAGAADDGGGQADVPVPARTPVLGEEALPGPAAVADTAPAAAPVAPAVARPDTCWRVQLAAWAERAKAERYLVAGRSQLAVPLAIEQEAGLFKVRTSDCLGGAAADALRRRAREVGFEGAFRFRGGKR